MRQLVVSFILLVLSFTAIANTQETSSVNGEETFDPIQTPLTFEAVSGTVTVIVGNYYCSSFPTIQYRVDGGDWTDITLTHNQCHGEPRYDNALPAGKIIQIRADKWDACFPQRNDGLDFLCDADCYVYGNILSITRQDYATNHEEASYLGYLFYKNTHIKNHPDKALVLPSTKLTRDCYQYMFYGCTGLTSAPVLPAPVLDADGCYQDMFMGCKNLNFVICLANSVTAENTTTGWLANVSPTGTFVHPASMTSWERSENGIPVGWNVQNEDEAKKCATPMISIKDGKVIFDCKTEGVEFHYEIVSPESVSGDGNNIPLPTTYTILVYATKEGYLKSDLATKDIELPVGVKGDTNDDGIIDATDIVNLVNIIMEK